MSIFNFGVGSEARAALCERTRNELRYYKPVSVMNVTHTFKLDSPLGSLEGWKESLPHKGILPICQPSLSLFFASIPGSKGKVSA